MAEYTQNTDVSTSLHLATDTVCTFTKSTHNFDMSCLLTTHANSYGFAFYILELDTSSTFLHSVQLAGMACLVLD